jgi:hypothetical protein
LLDVMADRRAIISVEIDHDVVLHLDRTAKA